MVALTRWAIFGLVLLLAVPVAHADWRISVGIDLATGGDSILLIGDLDASNALYANCASDGVTLFLESYDGRTEEPVSVGPVNLLITPDTGGPMSNPATYRRERPGYITVRLGDPNDIARIVAAIVGARSAVEVAIEFIDTGDLSSWTANARGSTAAGRDFLARCGFDANVPGPAPEPTPGPAPAQPAPDVTLAQPGPQAVPERSAPAESPGPVRWQERGEDYT